MSVLCLTHGVGMGTVAASVRGCESQSRRMERVWFCPVSCCFGELETESCNNKFNKALEIES